MKSWVVFMALYYYGRFEGQVIRKVEAEDRNDAIKAGRIEIVNLNQGVTDDMIRTVGLIESSHELEWNPLGLPERI